MFELKPISQDSISTVLEKAERYRLLNEAIDAESICLDVLAVDATEQQALITLVLALTDQFERKLTEKYKHAREALGRLTDDYNKAYYSGIIAERRAKVSLQKSGPGSGHVAFEWFSRAMESFEQAIAISPPGNDDAILRWNTCARIINRNPEVVPDPEERVQEMLE